MKILVLEHDTVARRWLETGIRARGHAVTVCADAQTAFEAYQTGRHPLVIVDWDTPRARGLCRLVRSGRKGSDALILAAGSSDGLAEVEDALRAGADDYVPAPADDGVLHARLAVAEARLRRIAERKRLRERHSLARRALQARLAVAEARLRQFAEGKGLGDVSSSSTEQVR